MDKKLSKDAYGGIEGSKYQPYVSKNEGLKEASKLTMVVGIILAIIFSASNAYAGLISGLTVAAGIPGTILGAGLMSMFSKKSNVLNTNLIQGMSSGGESIASGMIFVFPAVFIIGSQVSFVEGAFVGVAGVLLGIAVTDLVYKYLIVDEHGTLVYPEAMAISETLVTSDTGGDSLKFMGIGAAISAILTVISNSVLGLVNSSVSYAGEKLKWQWATDVNPLLIGIGFIVGLEVSMAMFAGSFLANFVIIPIIGYFTTMADPSVMVWNNPDLSIVDMAAGDIQGSYTKYIGAGMMLCGGLIGAIRLIPTIIESVKATIAGANNGSSEEKGSKIGIILLIAGLVSVLVSAFIVTSSVMQAVVGGLLAILFVFLFAIVAGKMTGDIGTSNLPVSGMTIASLLIVTLAFLLLGWTSPEDNKAILLLGTTIVIGISAAGGYSQSQKVTYIIGGTKDQMTKAFTIAGLIGVLTVTGVILILSPQLGVSIDAPQANLMATLTQGVLNGNLPWAMIFTGVFFALVFYFLNLPIMTVAIGFYLPMGTVTIILLGALIRVVLTKVIKDEKELEQRENHGIILSAGLVAGGAVVGLLGAALAVFTTSTGNIADASFFVGSSADGFMGSNAVAIIQLVILTLSIYGVVRFSKTDGEK